MAYILFTKYFVVIGLFHSFLGVVAEADQSTTTGRESPSNEIWSTLTPLTATTTTGANITITMNDTLLLPISQIQVNSTRIENCDPIVCQEDICRVNGSISRPSFYARCPTLNNIQDSDSSGSHNSSAQSQSQSTNGTSYCMCSAAYHVASTDQNNGTYIQILPSTNCVQREHLCSSSICQGEGNLTKSNRVAYVCRHQNRNKFYCACFN